MHLFLMFHKKSDVILIFSGTLDTYVNEGDRALNDDPEYFRGSSGNKIDALQDVSRCYFSKIVSYFFIFKVKCDIILTEPCKRLSFFTRPRNLLYCRGTKRFLDVLYFSRK